MSGREPELVVEADLVDPGIPVPARGEAWVISLMRYSVVQVLSGEYPHDELFVGHDDPDLDAAEFREGVRHRLWLTPTFPEQAAILSPVPERPHGAFYCLRFELV
jgi:hypothetical protein